MITSDIWIQDSFWLLLPADLIVCQHRTIKPSLSQKKREKLDIVARQFSKPRSVVCEAHAR